MLVSFLNKFSYCNSNISEFFTGYIKIERNKEKKQ